MLRFPAVMWALLGPLPNSKSLFMFNIRHVTRSLMRSSHRETVNEQGSCQQEPSRIHALTVSFFVRTAVRSNPEALARRPTPIQ